MHARVIGTGSYLPQQILTNYDLEKKLDTSDAWIIERTGIRERHIAAKDETTSDMATRAGRAALDAAGVAPSDVDLILVATATPDRSFPSTACLVQYQLKARRAAAMDISAACSGFLYALSVGVQYIQNKVYQNVLVIGAEKMSRIVDWTDRQTSILFGDGAGALLLSASKQKGVLSTHLHSDGSLWELLYVSDHIKMKGGETFKAAVKAMEQVAREALTHNGMDISDVDFLIPHQANVRIIKTVAERIGFEMTKAIMNIAGCGNTSAASIPVALDEAVRDGRITKGNLLLFLAFGGGLTWGSALVRW